MSESDRQRDQQHLLELVYSAIDEFNASVGPERQLVKAPTAALFDAQGSLDSLELVHLIVAVEQRVFDQLGKTVVLADEKAFSRTRSPFRDVDALLEHLQRHLDEGARG